MSHKECYKSLSSSVRFHHREAEFSDGMSTLDVTRWGAKSYFTTDGLNKIEDLVVGNMGGYNGCDTEWNHYVNLSKLNKLF